VTINSFIPTLWAGRLLANLNNSHVAASLVNRDYEGEIKQAGDTVKINSIGRPTVKAYTRNSDIDTPEQLNTADQSLRITEEKYFNFAVDNVDKAQVKASVMESAMREASWAMADVTDIFLFNKIYTMVAPANALTPTDLGLGAADGNLYEILTDLARVHDENNTPSGDRWAGLTPKMLAHLRKDPRFSSFGTDKNRSVIRGESLGDIAGFSIHMSNNLPDAANVAQWGDGGTYDLNLTSGDQVLLTGYKGAVTFAEQVTETVAFKPERRFGDAVKGLHVYGATVTRPSNLAMATFGYAA
jgi:hypothetical protein